MDSCDFRLMFTGTAVGVLMNRTTTSIKDTILPILHRYGAYRAGLFGSIARGEERDDSDVDILVELAAEISLLDFVRLRLELEEALKRKVDLVEYSCIKALIRERILADEIRIL